MDCRLLRNCHRRRPPIIPGWPALSHQSRQGPLGSVSDAEFVQQTRGLPVGLPGKAPAPFVEIPVEPPAELLENLSGWDPALKAGKR